MEPVEDLSLVALAPADLVPVQAELVAWCERKLEALKTEQSDMETNLELATAHGWKHASVASVLRRTEKRVLYYEKIKAAVEAGYVIVPNFPIDVFAVRVNREKQPEKTRDSKWQGFPANPQLLAAGEGHYVDNQVQYRDESYVETLPEGKEKHIRRYVTDDYDAVDFPVTVVKPAVLQATQRAMALRLFDQIGMVSNQSAGDPIVVGQLLDPRGRRRCVTFFVAWWLDTASL